MGKYGLAIGPQDAILESFIDLLPPSSVVLYLGAGTNPYGELNNLGRRLAARPGNVATRLLVGEISGGLLSLKTSIQQFGHGAEFIQLVQLDATNIAIGHAAVQMVIALGLFGQLFVDGEYHERIADDETQHGVKRVMDECYRVLQPDGVFMIGNAEEHKPRAPFEALAGAAGFDLVKADEYALYGLTKESLQTRYLLVFRKGRSPAVDGTGASPA